jgi:hypothetical protein
MESARSKAQDERRAHLHAVPTAARSIAAGGTATCRPTAHSRPPAQSCPPAHVNASSSASLQWSLLADWMAHGSKPSRKTFWTRAAVCWATARGGGRGRTRFRGEAGLDAPDADTRPSRGISSPPEAEGTLRNEEGCLDCQREGVPWHRPAKQAAQGIPARRSSRVTVALRDFPGRVIWSSCVSVGFVATAGTATCSGLRLRWVPLASARRRSALCA